MDSYIGRHAIYCVEESTHGWLNMSSIFVAFAIVVLQRYGDIPFISSFSGDGEEGTFEVVVKMTEDLTAGFALSQGSGSYWIDITYYATKNKRRKIDANECTCSSAFSYGDNLYNWIDAALDKAEEFAFKD